MANLVAQGMPPPMRVRPLGTPEPGNEGDPDAPDAQDSSDDQDDIQETEVWPCNVQSVRIFIAMQTQWRTGFVGRTGLDYGVLPQVMGWERVDPGEQAETWADVRLMEVAALGVWAEQAQRDRERQERSARQPRSRR